MAGGRCVFGCAGERVLVIDHTRDTPRRRVVRSLRIRPYRPRQQGVRPHALLGLAGPGRTIATLTFGCLLGKLCTRDFRGNPLPFRATEPFEAKPPPGEGGLTRVGFSREAMCALLPLSGRERAGVRVPAHGASSPSPRPSPPAGARETKAAAPVLSRKKTYPRKHPTLPHQGGGDRHYPAI